jgi:hypothetical protein
MLRKDLDMLVERVITGASSAEQVLFDSHLDYAEALYLMKHLTSERIDQQLETSVRLS